MGHLLNLELRKKSFSLLVEQTRYSIQMSDLKLNCLVAMLATYIWVSFKEILSAGSTKIVYLSEMYLQVNT